MPQRLLTVREAIRAALERIAHDDGRDGLVRWPGPIPGDPDWAGGTVFTRPAHAAGRGLAGRASSRAVLPHRRRPRLVRRRLALAAARARSTACSAAPACGAAAATPSEVGLRRRPRLLARHRRRARTAASRLRAEMKLPGEALLEFAVDPGAASGTRLTQTARFMPRGLAGLAYWYAVLPLHGLVFDGMLRGIRDTARGLASRER